MTSNYPLKLAQGQGEGQGVGQIWLLSSVDLGADSVFRGLPALLSPSRARRGWPLPGGLASPGVCVQ